jgi:hypothetical protein
MTLVTADAAIGTLKARLKATWMDGNYDYFSRFMASSAVHFLDRLPIKPCDALLDVACGSGQVALVAAERGLKVTGVVAGELLRVCRPSGIIAMGNWTKEGFVGAMFKTFARFLMPADMPSPVLWGDENVVRERFGAGVSDLRLTRVCYQFDYPFGPPEVVEFFRQYYGPATRAFASLGGAEQGALRADLVRLWTAHNTAAAAGRTIVDAEYLEVVATRA